MYKETKELYAFGPFRLDVVEHTLTRIDGSIDDVLPEKAFQTLCVLVQKRGHLLTKQELLAEIWPDSFVEENNLDKCIHAIRQILGEKPGEKKYIETVRKHGYRFVADVNTVGAPNGSASSILDSEFLQESEIRSTVPELASALRPIRISRTRRSIALIAVIFLAAAIGSGYLLYPAKNAAADGKTKFAVLPMKPIDAANRSDLYELGVAESLIQKLNSTKGLIVRPISAVRRYSDVAQDALAAGREQKVDYVLASNYQIADGKIRITSQLLNVATGQIEETFKSEKEVSNVFAMQDAIAGEFGNKLARFFGIALGPSVKRGTANEEAYGLYNQATVLADKRNQEGSRKAIEYLEQAVQLDPNYAIAYARLANAHSTLVYTGGSEDPDEEYVKAGAAIQKALAIDDNLAEAHSYLGELNHYQGKFAEAEREDKRGIELNPNSSVTHNVYAILLNVLGRSDESIAEVKKALDLEPASAVNHQTYAWLLFFARRYDDAITESKRALEIDPEYYFAYNVLTNSYHAKGDDDHAFESLMQMLRLEGEEPDEIDLLKAIYARSGWRGVRQQQLDDLKGAGKTSEPFPQQMAFLSIELGQLNEALGYLKKELDLDPAEVHIIKANPRYDPLRSDQRFDDLLKRADLYRTASP